MREADANVDRRRDARIERGALDEVKSIQTLLADVYKDAGDGRTLLRELVQNADDARATRQKFLVLDSGWPDAENGLLRGPALVVANDGPFPATDRDAVHRAIGGSKAEDAGKVGRFGIGLKSVFHICEAFVYLGAESGTLRPGALNPWAGTDGQSNADPLHPDWDKLDGRDRERLVGLAKTLMGEFDDGLVQWFPLRRPEHLDRARDRRHGLGLVCPGAEEVAAWFGRTTSLALLLTQCGYLRSVDATRADGPDEPPSSRELARVTRPGFESRSWVGRHDDDSHKRIRRFEGTIEARARTWSVVGVDAVGGARLTEIRRAGEWPTEPHWRDGRCVWLPRKALAHAAIAVLRRTDGMGENPGIRLRWAVFLPLDDDPAPRRSRVVEQTQGERSEAWDIVLHGYFWPSQDRRSIPGVTDDDEGAGDTEMRSRWNRAVRDELLLPLLPRALANAVEGLEQRAACDLVRNVSAMPSVKRHLAVITRDDVLLPVAQTTGVGWSAFEREQVKVLAVSGWCQAPPAIRSGFLAREFDHDVVVIDADAPRLGGEARAWSGDLIASLVGSVSAEILSSADTVNWTGQALLEALGSFARPEDDRVATIAHWLVRRMGEGALAPAVNGPEDGRERLRESWRILLKILPEQWVLEAPISSYHAVVELARDEAIGVGLLPLPLGRGPNEERDNPQADRIDHALRVLGNLLREEGGPSSQRLRQSRLVLAESFLSARGDLRLEDELSQLPLLRARELPADKDVAWSVEQLRCEAEADRVFSSPGQQNMMRRTAPPRRMPTISVR